MDARPGARPTKIPHTAPRLGFADAEYWERLYSSSDAPDREHDWYLSARQLARPAANV